MRFRPRIVPSTLAYAIACALAVVMPAATRAQSAPPPPVSLRETARMLARSGQQNEDPRAVIGAAQLMITAERLSPAIERVEGPSMDRPRAGERRTFDSAAAPEFAAALPAEPADSALERELASLGGFTARALLRLASRMAVRWEDVEVARLAAALAADSAAGVGDSVLAAPLRRAADALPVRGPAGGPIWADGNIRSRATAEFKVRFRGDRERNRIEVSASNPRANLDCYLYEGDKLAVRDEGRDGNCAMEWRQTKSSLLTLRVRNNGADTYYVLMSK